MPTVLDIAVTRIKNQTLRISSELSQNTFEIS